MSKQIERFHPTMELEIAAKLMFDNKIDCLPVTRSGKILEIITTTDLLESIWSAPEETWRDWGTVEFERMTQMAHYR